MKKRIFSLVLVLCIIYSSLCARLLFLAVGSKETFNGNGSRTRIIASSRGAIYDQNGKRLTETTHATIACILPTAEAVSEIKTLPEGEEIIKELKTGALVTAVVDAGQSFLTDDITLLPKLSRYKDNTAVHICGYLNSANDGVSGIEKIYNSYFKETGGALSLNYSTDALSRVLVGERITVLDDNYYSDEGLMLTLDSEIQSIVEAALKSYGINAGAAVVLDTKSGEILASASVPEFDRFNPSAALKSKNSPFLNRAFSAYAVGSVFKVVTAASALENKISINTFTCNGHVTLSGNLFYCSHRDGHGELDLQNALAVSCNPYFITLAAEVGAEKLTDTAGLFGFGKQIDLGNGYIADSGNLPSADELNSDAAVGNVGFGQGSLTASPLQIAALYAALANDGIYNIPSIIKGTVNSDGVLQSAEEKAGKRVVKTSTCEIINRALLLGITDGTGKKAKSSLFASAGKTATAETGQTDYNGIGIKTTWFAGFFPYDEPRYAVCIMNENGVTGSLDCAPIFKEISENIFILERIRAS